MAPVQQIVIVGLQYSFPMYKKATN